MSKIGEVIVQAEALHYLKNKYRFFSKGRKIFAETEVKTKPKYGGKRADGLVVFRHWWQGNIVISIEAKSYKTLPALNPIFQPFRLLWSSIWAGVLICILTGAFFAIFKMDDFTNRIVIPLNVFMAGALLYAVFSQKNYRNYRVKVIDQLEQYPANEQWLAFSADALQSLSRKKRRQLKAICRDKGIGILVVKKYGRIKVILSAKRRFKWLGDYISFYSNEQTIRKAIK